MHSQSVTVYQFLRSTALTGLFILSLAPLSAQAFNPNDGIDPVAKARSTNSTPSRLPSTAPLTGAMPKLAFPDAPAPSLATQAAPRVVSSDSAAIAPAVITPESAAIAPAPVFPPVDAATQAQAARELQAANAAAPVAMPAANIGADSQRTFIAPAPLIAVEPVAPAMAPEPVGGAIGIPAASVGAVAPAPLTPLPSAAIVSAPVAAPEQLSDASKTILSKVPSKLDASKAKQGGKMKVSRMSPDLQALPEKTSKTENFDSVGLSIQVQRPGLDSNFELNRAYNTLAGGDSAGAIDIYKNILSAEPNNEDALFGLATVYHRQGKLDAARPYYGQLLKVNPNHRDGLNNFLALVSEESPQEALAELERLEQRNPDFSPIPAQQAVVLQKMGYADKAREKMLRAIDLAPENLTYKYNLAVMLDRSGQYADASALYRLLIDASLKGEKLPTSLDAIQKRLNFIASAAAPAVAVGG